MSARAAKVIIEVTAGLIPGQPDSEHTRQWGITSDEWERAQKDYYAAGAVSFLLATRAREALGYASLLMLQPDRVNWVHTDWIYL